MAKQNPIKRVYKVSKVFKEVRHYISEDSMENINCLTENINISKDRKFSKAKNISYWLKIRINGKWSNSVTGLKDSHIPLVYYGDISRTMFGRKNPNHLIIFHFEKGGNRVALYLYENYYPSTTTELNQILNSFKKKRV